MTDFVHNPPAYTRLQEMPPPPPVPSGPSVVINTAPPAIRPEYVRVLVDPAPGTAGHLPAFIHQHVPRPLTQSFGCHITLACMTFWFCGFVFGFIAFILAVVAQSHSTSLNESDRRTAHVLGKWSIGISMVGIVIGILLIIILPITLTMAAAVASSQELGPL